MYLQNKLFAVIGLLLNIIGVFILAFVVRAPIVPICNNEGVCITTGGEILKLVIPSENSYLLKLGLIIIFFGFLFQFLSVIWPTKN